MFLLYFDQINAALVSIRNLLKKIVILSAPPPVSKTYRMWHHCVVSNRTVNFVNHYRIVFIIIFLARPQLWKKPAFPPSDYNNTISGATRDHIHLAEMIFTLL